MELRNMKNTYKLFSLMLILLVVSMLPLGSALFPKSHAYLIAKQCQSSSSYSSELAKMCCADVNACIAGNTLADISVIYYLEKGLKKYSVTHSDLFCTNAISASFAISLKVFKKNSQFVMQFILKVDCLKL